MLLELQFFTLHTSNPLLYLLLQRYLCKNPVQNLLDICVECSNIHLLYCTVVPSGCNVHMMTLLARKVFILVWELKLQYSCNNYCIVVLWGAKGAQCTWCMVGIGNVWWERMSLQKTCNLNCTPSVARVITWPCMIHLLPLFVQ